MEEYFQQHGKVSKGTRVSCGNKGALTAFDKKDKRISAASSNADVRRALRELDRPSSATYKLEPVKGHQDRKKKLKSLTLEARLNVKCDEMAKQAVHTGISEARNGAAESNAVAGEMQCVCWRGRANVQSEGSCNQANGGTRGRTGVLREQACT